MRRLIEPSHLDLCCLQKPIIIAYGSERVNRIEYTIGGRIWIFQKNAPNVQRLGKGVTRAASQVTPKRTSCHSKGPKMVCQVLKKTR